MASHTEVLKPSTDYIHDSDLVSDVKDASTHHTTHLDRLSPEELEVEKRLRRKIDLRIMPLVVIIYLLNYLDR